MPDRTKSVLVTGANSGMGKALSLEMALLGYQVFMLCRDVTRGQAAAQDVIAQSGNSNVLLEICDLASLTDIRRFAKAFTQKYVSLDILVNNAGVILPKRSETQDGFEMQLGVNHLGHFLLTNLLFELLLASASPRIVIVSSGAHVIGRIHFDDINMKKGYTLIKAYAQSKLANILFCFELARRLEGKNVTVNSLHPGAVATNMGVDRETGFGKLITSLLKPFFKSPKQGADTALYLAHSPEVQGITGQYFVSNKTKQPSKSALDTLTASRLWEMSETMTGKKFEP